MSSSLSYQIRTDKDVEFTGAIAQNAAENENIVVPWALPKLDLTLTSITLISDQNLAWELCFWATDLFGSSSNMDLDNWIGNWPFQVTDGSQIASTGNYRYNIPDLNIPLRDDDGTQELHVSLVNRSATSKNAGATGEVVVTFHVEAEQVGGA